MKDFIHVLQRYATPSVIVADQRVLIEFLILQFAHSVLPEKALIKDYLILQKPDVTFSSRSAITYPINSTHPA